MNAQDLAILLANWGREAAGLPELDGHGGWTQRGAPCCVTLDCCLPSNTCGCAFCPEWCGGGGGGDEPCDPNSLTQCNNPPCLGDDCGGGGGDGGGDDCPEPPCNDCMEPPCDDPCDEPPCQPKCDDCPDPPDDGGPITLRFIHHAPTDPEDPDGEWEVEELDHLNISTFVTTANLLAADGWEDPDNFKIELVFSDPAEAPASAIVDLEALRESDGQPFADNNPHRRLEVVLTPDPLEPEKLRSQWLRLVVDRFDRESMPDQTLLIWTDPPDPANPAAPTQEILGQRVRGLYIPPDGGAAAGKELLVGDDVKTFKLRVHIVSEEITEGLAGEKVDKTSVEERIYTYVRQAYSQVNMKPEIVEIIEDVEPVQNMISIGHPFGTRAAAGDTFAITIESLRGGQAVRWEIEHVAEEGDTPEQTANEIAQKIAAAAPTQGGDPGDRLTAQVFINPPTSWGKHGDGVNPGTNLGAADILVMDPGGGLVMISEVTVNDQDKPEMAAAPRAPGGPPNPNPIVPGRLTIRRNGDLFSGSVEQRALSRNYITDDEPDIIEVFVVNTLQVEGGGGARSGQVTLLAERTADIHGLEPGVSTIANNVFVNANSVLSSPQWMTPPHYRYAYGEHGIPFVLPHEIGHVLLDADHVQDDMTQLMRKGTPNGVNSVTAAKRISRELSQFNVPGLSENPEFPNGVLESLIQGDLMRAWPNHP